MSLAKTSVYALWIPLFFFVFSIEFLCFNNSLQAQPEESSGDNVLFILDSSGSMAGQLEGKAKIDVAKEVMTNLIKELPDGVKVGLEVYGHRSKGDCNDIEVMVPIGEVDKEALIKKIESMHPKGKTPIAKSLEMAGEQLQAMEEETTVVLVSDGEETCEGDPCVLTQSLKEKGIKVKVHVVGFDVGDKEKEQLSCIAEAGGGRYFTAKNADQLKEALAEVKKEVVEKVEAPKIATLPKGGDRIETAVPLPFGDYIAGHEVKQNTQEYYSVKIKAGQTVVVKFRTPDKAHSYAGAAIYNEGKEQLVEDTIIGAGSTLKTIGWTTNSMKDEYTFYIGLGNQYDPNAKGTTYSFSAEDSFDVNISSDVGDTFEKPLQIEPGTYKGFLAGKWGDDRKDFYSIPLKAEQKVSIKLTPPIDVGYKVSIWDQDRVNVAEKASANPGAIARVSWTPPEEQEGVFLLIEPSEVPDKSTSLGYTIEIKVE
ncbi:MAG TPA: VWA domain-containing protein [Thermodesulfobacteriota bacterium]